MTSSCGTVTVVEPFDPDLVSATCSLPSSTVSPGETVTVETTLTNDNPSAAGVSVSLVVNGDELVAESETIPGGSSASVTFDVSFDEAGDYDLTIEYAAEPA